MLLLGLGIYPQYLLMGLMPRRKTKKQIALVLIRMFKSHLKQPLAFNDTYLETVTPEQCLPLVFINSAVLGVFSIQRFLFFLEESVFGWLVFSGGMAMSRLST